MCAVLLFVAASAGAAGTTDVTSIVPGDVVLDEMSTFCCIATPPPTYTWVVDPNDPKIDVFPGTRGRFPNTMPRQFAIATDGKIVAAGRNSIYVYDSAFHRLRTIDVPLADLTDVLVDANGNIFTRDRNGALRVFLPDGTLARSFTLPNAGQNTRFFDLAPDGCTIFYDDVHSNGRRFNGCTGQPLPDLIPGVLRTIRATADGGYFAVRETGHLYELVLDEPVPIEAYDAENRLLRMYTPATFGGQDVTAIAFDSNPAYFWVGGLYGLTRKVRVSDGQVMNRVQIPSERIVVYGEQRASIAAVALGIPTLSTFALAALAIAFAIVAARALT
jgi:hypothetical protein